MSACMSDASNGQTTLKNTDLTPCLWGTEGIDSWINQSDIVLITKLPPGTKWLHGHATTTRRFSDWCQTKKCCKLVLVTHIFSIHCFKIGWNQTLLVWSSILSQPCSSVLPCEISLPANCSTVLCCLLFSLHVLQLICLLHCSILLLLQQPNFPTAAHKVSFYRFTTAERSVSICTLIHVFSIFLSITVRSGWRRSAGIIAWVNLQNPGLRLLGIHRFHLTEEGRHTETGLPWFCKPIHPSSSILWKGTEKQE